ncbi:MAG: radical SAM protein [Desulfosarcina sp.]|jgi:wyosine [tRNA(Phe)-imidazoG37] synthetase (radical SAM superfamily)
MTSTQYRHLFGPVPSRRFGRSLGIDLTPYKTCSMDCVFCQLGRTSDKTLTRKRYVPTAEVVAEIEHWLKVDGEADYLTLSGSGEPTLHAEFGNVLSMLRDTPILSALLTNGTLLQVPEVRAGARLADVVKVSLSVWDQQSFFWVNRPHPKLDFRSYYDGLKQFRHEFSGQLWLEVFLLSGINAVGKRVEAIAALARELAPDRIHLNTVVRPPAEAFAAAVSLPELEKFSGLFDPPAHIAAESSNRRSKASTADPSVILAMLRRRPCTNEQIQAAFGLHINEVSKTLGQLIRNRLIRATVKHNDIYYRSA